MIRLNSREEEIMNIFWKLKKAFPKEIINQLDDPNQAYNTILSIIRKLEKDGFIDHHKIGKTHQYFPTISKRHYQKSLMGHLLKDYFGGSPEKLLSFFIKEEKISKKELQEILSKHSENKQ
ncbi:BlaI/MecI/CopY family transcriptional regulator [Saprospiraceae bacterium]|nr:BlaI/MecI/CopY family transcriptional regulator [Saprospiraceae bacterium]